MPEMEVDEAAATRSPMRENVPSSVPLDPHAAPCSTPTPHGPRSQPEPRPAPSLAPAPMRVPSPLPSTPVPRDPDVSHSFSLPDLSVGAVTRMEQPAPTRAPDQGDDWDDEFDAEFGDSLDQLCDEDFLQVRAGIPIVRDTGAGAGLETRSSAGVKARPSDAPVASSRPCSMSPPPEHRDEPCDPKTPSFMEALPPGMFVTAKGTSLPVLSDQALEAARARMDAWERDDDQAAKATKTDTVHAAPPSTQAKGKNSLASAPRALPSAVRTPSSLHTAAPTGIPQRSVSAPKQSTSLPASRAAFTAPARAVSTAFTTNHKRPAQDGPASTPTPAARARTSASTSTPTPRAIVNGSLARSNSGPSTARGTLGARTGSSAKPMTRRKAFKTPFKSGSRPAVTPSASRPQTPGAGGAASVSPVRFAHPGDVSVGTPSRIAGYPIRGAIPTLAMPPMALFDLDPEHAPHRISLLDMRLRPESISATTAAGRGCPREAFTVLNDPSMAENFEFLVSARTTYSPEDALRVLKQLGASHLSLKWVRHHWGMILWKLAAMTRHQPERASHWWSWDQVLRQLRYRYEREINVGQRSAINRIKQHDSAASQPVVLCVYKLEYGPAADEQGTAPSPLTEQDDTVLQPTLVLSDGWYTIRAQLDDTLYDTLQRGRIRMGNKLCIMGAKCEGGPVEALEGFSTIMLHLHANGTQLAPWDARLGFRRSPWVSSLRSLSPLGGKVGLVRIRITQAFDLGYLDTSSSERGAVHSAAEEAERQAEWEKERSEVRVQLEQASSERLARSQETVQAIASLLASPGQDTEDEADASLDDKLDQLFEAADAASALHRLFPGDHGLAAAVLHRARERDAALRQEIEHEMAADLDERVPTRRVRAFRVVKCEDAIPPVPAEEPMGRLGLFVRQARKARGTGRTAQITVWGADQLELPVGQCFLVSSAVPSAPASWRAPDEDAEIFLQTRQGAQWIPIPDPDPDRGPSLTHA